MPCIELEERGRKGGSVGQPSLSSVTHTQTHHLSLTMLVYYNKELGEPLTLPPPRSRKKKGRKKRHEKLTILRVAVAHGEARAVPAVGRLGAVILLVVARPAGGAGKVGEGGAVDGEGPRLVARLEDLLGNVSERERGRRRTSSREETMPPSTYRIGLDPAQRSREGLQVLVAARLPRHHQRQARAADAEVEVEAADLVRDVSRRGEGERAAAAAAAAPGRGG